jgi:hypothetical protein
LLRPSGAVVHAAQPVDFVVTVLFRAAVDHRSAVGIGGPGAERIGEATAAVGALNLWDEHGHSSAESCGETVQHRGA